MSVAGKPGYKETTVGWIPVEWEARTLAECAVVTMGQSPAGDTYNTDGLGTPLLNGPTEFTDRYPVRIQWTTAPTKLCKPGDILICVRGSSTGRMNIANDEYCIGRGLSSIRYKDGFSQDYLIQLLSFSVSELLKSAVGSTFPSIDGKAISSINVLTPPFPEQQKIAAILTAVDDKLDLIARQISATQTLKQGLMQTLFTRGAGTPDAQGRWHPHTEFQDTELGRIPVGWRVQSVGDVCEVKGGKRLPKGESLTEENTGFPYIRVTDMYMGGVNASSVLYVPAHLQPLIKRYTISKDDIFISVAGTLGLVGTISPALDGANLTENADKLTNITISRDYLLYCLCSPSIQDAISKEATANAQPKLALERIRGFKIPTPAQAEQQKIADMFKSVDDKLSTLTTQQTHYQSLKRGLMQKLLTGEWRVRLN